MAEAQILFSNRRSKSIGSLTVDAFVREGHKRTNSVTDVQIEDGSQISDHATKNPIILDIEGVIGPVAFGSTVATPTRILDAFNALNEMADDLSPLTVLTGLKIYDNMLITELNFDRDVSTGQSLPFTMSLKQAEIVKSQTVQIPKTQLGGGTGTSRQAQATADAGRSQANNSQASFLDPIRADVRKLLGAP